MEKFYNREISWLPYVAKKAAATLLLTVLWAFNSYAQDPWLIKDINSTGAKNGPVGDGNSISGLATGAKTMFSANGVAFFTADDGIHGTEMWRTDGTAAGTFMLADITAGAASTTFGDVYEAGNLIYFMTNGSLWRTDGTVTGTFSIVQGSSSHNITRADNDVNGTYLHFATVLGNNYYFIVTDDFGGGDFHDRVYKTDGTVAGTSLYYDAGLKYPGQYLQDTVYGSVRKIIAFGNKIYIIGVNNVKFIINGDGSSNINDVQNDVLTAGDGVSAPTVISSPGGAHGFGAVHMVNVNDNYLLIDGLMGNDPESLYRLKPTETTPVLLPAGNNSSLVSGSSSIYISKDFTSGNLYFFRDGNNGKAVTNGEVSGTFSLSGITNTSAAYTGIANNKMTFVNEDAKLYSWDGLSPTSYQVVSDSLTGKGIDRVVQAGDRVFYLNSNQPVRVSDLSGNNCLSVYPGPFDDRGFVLNNSYVDFGTAADGSFNAGSEPHILNTTFKIFTGAVSNDWNTTGNWLPNGVPVATDDVVIPSLSSTLSPVITGTANCRNLTMYQSSLTVSAGAVLNINGYVAKPKAIIQGPGTVNLKGPGETIYGSSFGNNIFDVASVNITGTDLSFATPGMRFNSTVNFTSANKITAPYTTLDFYTKPFITGYNSNSYIITGNGNSVNFHGAGSSSTADSLFTIPVGTSATSYTPVSFSYKFDDASFFGVSLADSVNRGGTQGERITSGILNKEWVITASTFAPTPANAGVTLNWNNTADELSAFDRSAGFIDNFNGVKWLPGNVQMAALNNSLYSIKQTYPIASLSTMPFIVSSDANLSPGLSGLAVSPGKLSPAFQAAINSYTAVVTNDVSSVQITPTAIHTTDIVRVKGVVITSGSSVNLPLAVGVNPAAITVTAHDGVTVQNYSLNVQRLRSSNAFLSNLVVSAGTLSPAFTSDTTGYTVSVGNEITAITITPTAADATAHIQILPAPVSSGPGAGSNRLNVGTNTISVSVVAQDGIAYQTYNVTVTRTAPPPAALDALTPSSGTISPVFESSITSYQDTVSNATTSITVTPVVSHPGASVKVNGKSITSGTASASIPLSVGLNTVTITVTGADGISTLAYVVKLTRLSNNANLVNLTISSGTLTPAFASATTGYTASVSNVTSSIQLTPTTSDVNAMVQVNGVTVTSGSASASVPLGVGINAVHAVVHAQDGTRRTYTVTVTRLSKNANLSNLTVSNGTLSPVFVSATTNYLDTVGNAASSIQLTPTTSDANATVQVNGLTMTSGSISANIPLAVGAHPIHIVVHAQDGTQRTYTVTVTRLSNNANLSNLTIGNGILNPVFVSATTNYLDTVSNTTSSIKLTPTTSDVNATVQVNGVITTSGSASASVPLGIGVNSVHAVVHAQDGTQRTYTVTVTRLSNNANLANLTISGGTLSPAFVSSTAAYTASVSNATASIMLTPTTSEGHATVTVSGKAVISGSASAAIPLVVGNNTIYTVVLAQDGTRKTYAITVKRLTPGGLNNLYLPGDSEQTPLISSLNEKVKASNILSPNGNGINDIWVIKNIAFYPDNVVTVYNRAGEVVFTKKGYANDWDGTYRGAVLANGTYYYRVELGNGNNIKGYITVVTR